jgi:hypothetical protein
MENMVKSEDDGKTKTHIGIPVSKGPKRLRLILTRPFHEAGHIVEIPQDDIKSIETISPGTFGEDPATD